MLVVTTVREINCFLKHTVECNNQMYMINLNVHVDSLKLQITSKFFEMLRISAESLQTF